MSEKYIYEKDVSENKELETSLKQSINNWANDIPHHPYKNLGDKIKVKSIWYKPAYPIRLRSQYEKRSKLQGEIPFTGQNIPSRKYYKLSDFNSWDISLVDIEEFSDSTDEYYVNGSQHVEDCYHCDALGWKVCHTCNGNKTLTCPSCQGAKKQRCNSCAGRGDKQCQKCGGTSRENYQVQKERRRNIGTSDDPQWTYDQYYVTETRTCTSCNGKGRKQCHPCHGTGEVTCKTCNGDGKITCKTCSGSGRVTCPICKGYKQLYHYFYVKRELDYTDQEICIIQDEIYDSFPEYLENYESYESKNIFSKKENSIDLDQVPEGNHLNSFINKFINKANDEDTDHHSMQFQQLEISCIDTWELKYEFEGKEYVIAFTGNDYLVIPGLSPIYEVAFNYWEKGISLARTFMYPSASRFLHKALKIGVFEIKDKVEASLNSVEEKLNQSYGLGSVIAFLLSVFFGGFFAYTYYSEVNYMFGYASFINDPESFLYTYHIWAQTIFSVFIVYISFLIAKSIAKKLGHQIPTAILRVGIGFSITIVFTSLFLVLWALINATGISIIISFVLMLAMWVLKAIWWIIKIILIVIYAIWSILQWIWGLFF